MSVKLVVDIWHCPYGDASTILVLMALADEANDKGEYTADIKEIARKARQSIRNCRYLLRKLEELDIIERFEARGRSHKNSYKIRIENLQNLQPLPIKENMQKVQPLQQLHVLENMQKVQELQVLEPEKPAKPATIAAQPPPFPPDPLTPEIQDKPKTQDLPPLPPIGGKRKKPKQQGQCMPEEPEAQEAIRLAIFDTNFDTWLTRRYPQTDAEIQWEFFVNQCRAKGYEYLDFRSAFMNSFTWDNSPAQRKGKTGSANGSTFNTNWDWIKEEAATDDQQ
jgi:DNA-binding Lrp family transcriptional regulator